MALDAGMVSALTYEFQKTLTGAKLEKIHQPEKDEIDLYLRAGGKPVRLVLSATPGNSKVFLSEEKKENPTVPPMFCTLLRKHLSGGILSEITQPGFERAVEFSFLSKDEMGYETKRKIICEMLGKYSNLIFTNGEGKILGVLRPVDFTASEKRQLLPGMIYEYPPLQEGKTDFLAETEEGFSQRAENALDRPADKFIVSTYRGISPLLAREIAFRASGCTDCKTSSFTHELWEEFRKVSDILRFKRFAPCAVRIEGVNTEYSFLPILQYGASSEKRLYDSPSRMLEEFFAERDRSLLVRRRAQDLYKLLTNTENRLLRKMEIQQKELAACGEKETFRQLGELITANLYALKKGQERVTLTNYFSEEMEEVTLLLDGRLSPAANAQKYFKRYTKAKNAEKELTEQLKKAESELLYIRSVIDALDRASLPADIEEIRLELAHTGYISQTEHTPPKKKTAVSKHLVYKTSGGFQVLCGRNNLQNEALTFQTADKDDWWFHVHGAPGSHVILMCDGVDDPPAENFTQAAMIAAVNSSLAGSGQVTVDYTKVRNLKKPPRSKPGFVIYHTNYSAIVTPDAQLVKKLECK